MLVRTTKDFTKIITDTTDTNVWQRPDDTSVNLRLRGACNIWRPMGDLNDDVPKRDVYIHEHTINVDTKQHQALVACCRC